MLDIRNKILPGSNQRPMLLDVLFPNKTNGKLILFVHGFKGFKDWGCWDKVAQAFVQMGYTFAKFNFSHNGTTIGSPLDFEDLEAFGHNNYSRELFDLDCVINYLMEGTDFPSQIERPGKLILIGHSRGGGISVLQANRDERVHAVITWASVPAMDYAWPTTAFIDQWREKGVYYIQNARTGQEMPLYFQFYEDFVQNNERYDLAKATNNLKVPMAIIHGTNDPAVPVEAAYHLNAQNKNSKICIISGADHVFGARHPYKEEKLPSPLNRVIQFSTEFLDEVL